MTFWCAVEIAKLKIHLKDFNFVYSDKYCYSKRDFFLSLLPSEKVSSLFTGQILWVRCVAIEFWAVVIRETIEFIVYIWSRRE